MKANLTYTYCVLQYRHSQVLGEVLNVGLLVYFPEQLHLAFLHPNRLARIATVYPNVQEKMLKAYLRSFAIRVAALNKAPEVFARIDLDESFVRFISNELIPEDSSALQFDSPRRGILNASSIDDIKQRLYNTYFSFFDSDANSNDRTDDIQLISHYKTLIKELEFQTGKDILSTSQKVQFDYVLRPKEGTDFKFDVAWQNGSLNLVKPVSFDVVRHETLQNKAFRFYGQFMKLQDYADAHNIRFDLLIAKPKDTDLFKYYDNAVKLLEEPRHVNLIFEENLRQYSIQTIEELSHHAIA